MVGGSVRSFIVGALAGVALGGGAVYKFMEDYKVEKAPSPSQNVEIVGRKKKEKKNYDDDDGDDDAATTHPAMRLGWPVSTESLLRVHSGYVASFDARTRNPRWVLEVLNKNTCRGPGDRKRSHFVEDETFGERFRNKLSDFRGSGYDRGHLAAAAGHKSSQLAMDETFRLCNISPQVGAGFNRDYWARLERFTRDLAWTAGGEKDVLVATGPLFLPTRTGAGTGTGTGTGMGTIVATAGQQRKTTTRSAPSGRGGADGDDGSQFGGEIAATTAMTTAAATTARPATEYEMRYPLLGSAPELTAVPTHFFKVILVVPPSSSTSSTPAPVTAAAAFVLPNAPIPADTPLERFVVPLAHLEAAAGLSFFRQGALGGATRGDYEAAERMFLETREEGLRQQRLIEPGSASTAVSAGSAALAASAETARKLGSTLHVCQLTACTLPVDEYVKGGAEYKGRSGGR